MSDEGRVSERHGTGPLRRAAALLCVVLVLVLAVAPPAARAQVADSLAAPADSLAPPPDSLGASTDSLAAVARADSAAARPDRRGVAFVLPSPGVPLTAVPARRPQFNAAALLAEAPGLPPAGAFHYDLGLPGWADGVSFGGLAPRRAALTLDGVPATDLFTGRPAWEWLPLDVVGPLRAGWGRGTVPVEANLRAYAAAVPVTELRYRAGGDALQFISATHAQTRRPGWVRRLGGDRARLQGLFHVSGREADAAFSGFNVSGWQVLARVGLALPAFSLEVTERHGRDRASAPSGLAPNGAFSTVFDPDRATVLDASANRETIRNDLAATLRFPIASSDPLTLTAYWTAETLRYTGATTPRDTTTARGDRLGFRAEQSFRLGAHALWARAEGWLDSMAEDSLLAAEDDGSVHLAVLDSLRLGAAEVGLEAGVTTGSGDAFPTLGASLATGDRVRFGASVRYSGAQVGRIERTGFGSLVGATPAGDERTLVATVRASAALGAFDVGVEASAIQQTDPRVLLAEPRAVPTDPPTVTFATAAEPFRRATGTLRLGWRDRARRGVYVRSHVSAHAFLDRTASDLHAREAEAVPPVWGSARLGVRALGLFDNALDLDLAVRGRGWAAFRGRSFHAPTALFALAPLDARPVDAGGTLDVFAEAGIGGGRATVFVVYENALAGRAVAGSYVVPVYPLPGPHLRFGVFWLLPS